MKSRFLHQVINSLMIVLTLVWPVVQPLQLTAADFYWDIDTSDVGNTTAGAGLGGNGTWDLATSNWWPVPAGALTTWTNTVTDRAIFTGPASVPVSLVTLVSGLNANQLVFERSGYSLSGGNLTLAGTAPAISVNYGESATIGTQLLGTAGLVKTGGGAVRLSNNTNLYTGTTVIENGAVVINNVGALGADTSAVEINGTQARGFGGGQLVLEGGYTSGVVFNRPINLRGNGPILGSAIQSVRSNTISGDIEANGSIAGVPQSSVISSSSGLLSMTGNVTVLGTAGTHLLTFGAAGNQVGNGRYELTGVLSGTGSIQKTGSGTLLLNPSDASTFAGTIRHSAGTIRVTDAASLGVNTGVTTSSPIDLRGGQLEVRSDSFTTARNVYVQGPAGSNANALFADHAIGSSVINGTHTYNNYSFEENVNLNFNGRNGYNMTFAAAPVQGGTDNSVLNNNLNGNLTFTGAFWSNTNNASVARNMTIQGVGNTLISGQFAAAAATTNHNLIKAGTGTLTISSTNATLDGSVSVNNGILSITDFRSINNAAAVSNQTINLGATTTTGVLATGAGTASAAGLTSNRTINLAGTTGGGTIAALHAAAAPLVINSTITATGGGSKTLTLAGTSTQPNQISGVIVNNVGNTTSLLKNGTGLWVLGANNTYTGSTTIAGGTLRLLANSSIGTSNTVSDTSALVFNNDVNQFAGGELNFVGVNGTATTETLGNLTLTNGAATIRLSTGGGNASSNLLFSTLTAPGKGTGLNIITDAATQGTVSITGLANTTATTLPGNGHIYINGTNFARAQGGVLVAPQYGVDAGFVNATGAGGLTAVTGNNVNVTGAITAQNTVAVTSLRTGSSITLNAAQTLGVRTGVGANDGGILVSGTPTISGGTGITTTGSGGLIFRMNATGDILTLSTPMLANTTGGFTKNGAGVLVLNANNLQTGNNTINEGTVRLGLAGSSLGANATSLTIRQGAALDLNGVTPASTVGGLSGVGSITNGGSIGPATLTIGGGNGAGTFNGVISDGAGPGITNLIKIGSGGQTLTGLSTYTGTTTIGSTGLVAVNTLANIGANSSIGRGDATNTASNQASLVFNGSTGGINYTGSASVSTDRLFTLDGTGARIQSNPLNNGSANNAALIFSNTGAIAYGAGAANQAQLLTLGGASTGDNTFNPSLSDVSGNRTGLTKLDAGVWHLGSVSNTYTGNTTITAGQLGATSSNLSTNSTLVINGGQLMSSGNFTRNIVATVTPGNANEVSFTAGGGFSAYNGKLGVSMGGVGSESSLTWGSGGFLPTGDLVLNSATATDEVEFRNPINLNNPAVSRNVTVNDNTSTGTDFATISGVISGTGNFTKLGAGNLQLFGANTYSGNTSVDQGTLTVLSLGNSGTPGPSSVGDTTNANVNVGAVLLGNGTTTAANLQYIGTGETSDRKIRLNTTTATNTIHADGSGALILTNVVNDAAVGAKILALRGSNTEMNTITSSLSDNGGQPLSVTVDGAATWVLTGTNSYTGNLTVNGGALGLTQDASIGGATSRLRMGNGSLFAKGADLLIPNTRNVDQNNNVTSAFIGEYSINVQGSYNLLAAANNPATTTNNISGAGKTLTFGGVTADLMTAARTWTINGTGNTIINGNITTSNATLGLSTTYAGTGNGSLRLNGQSSDFNNGLLTISSGRLIIGNNEVIPDSSGADSGDLAFNPSTANPLNTATMDLNGFNETVNSVTVSGNGTTIIDNTAATPVTFGFGGNGGNSTFGPGAGAGTNMITDSGTGALSITKIGAGSATIQPGWTLDYSGTTTVTGGNLTIQSPVDGTTALIVSGTGSGLALSGITGNTSITTVNVGEGSTLNLAGDNAGNKLSSLTSLTLGSAVGFTDLTFNAGDVSGSDMLNTDTLTLAAGGALNLTAGNQIRFNITDAGLNPLQQYVLLDSTNIGGGFFTGALTSLDYILGSIPGGFTSMDLTTNSTDTQIILTTGTLITGTSYWTGLVDTAWNGNAANWSDDKAGTISSTGIPGAGTDVVFVADNIAGGTINTTLEQNFKINSLTFEASATTPTAVNVDPGLLGGGAGNTLQISPQVATAGIAITAGGPANVTISAPVEISKNQTWNVADANSTLRLTAGLKGAADATQTGNGTVVLSAAANGAFNTANTSDIAVNGGRMELTNSTALGSTGNANLARVAINTNGTFYYNNATSGTVANNLTLNGGVLSAGGNNQTYSGAVSVNSTSSVNLRDNAAVALNGTARNVTLSGNLTGAGDLNVVSSNATTNGNQIGGTLVLGGNNTGWSGNVNVSQGTVQANNQDALGSSPDVTASGGRMVFAAPGGQTFSMNSITLDGPGAIFELNANASGLPVTDMLVNVNGPVTLGSAISGNTALRLTLDGTDNFSVIDINGGVVLGNHSSISTSGSLTRNARIQTVGISETMVGSILSINDDFGPAVGSWNQTNRTLEINAAGNYTGGTLLNSGILQLGNKAALGNGTLTITGASTLRAGVDLSTGGSGPIDNAVTLNADLTTAGPNNLTINGTLTGTGNNANRTLTNTISAGSALVVSGPVDLAAVGNNATRTFTIAGNGTTSITGAIANGNADLFPSNLTVTSTGTTTIAGLNTYSGTTNMNGAGGTLVMQGSNSSAGNTTLSTGTIQFDSALNGGLASGVFNVNGGTMQALGAPQTLSNNAVFGGNVNVNGTQSLTLNGTSVQNGSRTITNNLSSGTFRAQDFALSDSGTGRTLTVTGTGATVIGNLTNSLANNTLASTVTGNGSLTVDTNVFLSENSTIGRTLTVNGIGDTTITGQIRNVAGGAGTASNLTKGATSTLFLGNSGNDYTGATTINNGEIRTTANEVIPDLSNVTINANGLGFTSTLNLDGNDETLGNVTFGGTGQTNTSVNQLLTGVGGSVTLSGNVTRSGTGDPNGAALIDGSVVLATGTRTFNIGDSVNSAVELDINGDVSGNGALTKTGAGVMSLNGTTANTYSGLTTVAAGELQMNKTAGFDAIVGDGISSKITPDVLVSGGTLRWNAADQLNDTVFIRQTGGTIDFNNQNETFYNFEQAGGTVNFGLGDITIEDPTWSGGINNIGGNLTVGSQFQIANHVPTVNEYNVLSGATLTIGTASTPGPLQFGGDNNNALMTVDGTLRFRAGSPVPLTFMGNGTSTGSIVGTGSFNLNGSTRTIDIGDATGSPIDMTIAVPITNSTGTAGFDKAGNGTLAITGTNTYNGPTDVQAGTLLVNGNNSGATGAMTVDAGAILGGNGIIGGPATIDGSHAPGANVGQVGVQTFNSTVDYTSGSTFVWDLLNNDASGRGTTFDGVDLTGTALTFASGVNSQLNFNSAGSSVLWADTFWDNNQQWLVFSGANSLAGLLDDMGIAVSVDSGSNSLAAARPGAFFSWTNTGNDVYLNYMTAVPEPASLGGATVLFGSWLIRRRMNRKKKASA